MTTKILAIVFGFFARMVLTHTLAMEYVGINGLYTNILGALNVSELGIGTALVYTMYGPVARGDLHAQKALMKLYRKIYFIVAGVVCLLGLAMLPVIRFFLKDTGGLQGATLIYFMYLARTGLSYVMMYRSMIFLANQRNYINDMMDSLTLVAQNTVQIIVLLLTKNYYLYLLVYVVTVVIRNFLIYVLAQKDYPQVFEPGDEQTDKEEEKAVYKNMKAMLMHKVGTVVINNIDNITLTAIVGLNAVGIYSNYFLIIGSIREIVDRVVYGIAGSVGNLGATADRDHVREVFLGTLFLVAAGYGVAGISLYELLDIFIASSFGQQYVFPKSVTAVLCLNLFLNGIRQASLIFRDSLGLFWYDRYKTMAESLVNLIASIILARRYGTAGVFLGTLISIVGISMWVEPLVLYREYFKAPVREYFIRLARYVLLFLAAWGITNLINHSIAWNSELVQYFGMIVVCLTVPTAVMIGLNVHTPEFRFVINHLHPKKENV